MLSAEQWIQRYPIAGVESVTVVCADGEINGAFFGTLGQMVKMYENMGADFSACETNEDKLAVILGTEGDGLASDTIANCDYTVMIPMSHEVDSLNVAAASAVAFWQLGKR